MTHVDEIAWTLRVLQLRMLALAEGKPVPQRIRVACGRLRWITRI